MCSMASALSTERSSFTAEATQIRCQPSAVMLDAHCKCPSMQVTLAACRRLELQDQAAPVLLSLARQLWARVSCANQQRCERHCHRPSSYGLPGLPSPAVHLLCHHRQHRSHHHQEHSTIVGAA